MKYDHDKNEARRAELERRMDKLRAAMPAAPVNLLPVISRRIFRLMDEFGFLIDIAILVRDGARAAEA